MWNNENNESLIMKPMSMAKCVMSIMSISGSVMIMA